MGSQESKSSAASARTTTTATTTAHHPTSHPSLKQNNRNRHLKQPLPSSSGEGNTEHPTGAGAGVGAGAGAAGSGSGSGASSGGSTLYSNISPPGAVSAFTALKKKMNPFTATATTSSPISSAGTTTGTTKAISTKTTPITNTTGTTGPGTQPGSERGAKLGVNNTLNNTTETTLSKAKAKDNSTPPKTTIQATTTIKNFTNTRTSGEHTLLQHMLQHRPNLGDVQIATPKVLHECTSTLQHVISGGGGNHHKKSHHHHHHKGKKDHPHSSRGRHWRNFNVFAKPYNTSTGRSSVVDDHSDRTIWNNEEGFLFSSSSSSKLSNHPKTPDIEQFLFQSLRHHFCFAHLSEPHLRHVVQAFECVHMEEAGTVIMTAGEQPGDYFYVLYQGRVAFTKPAVEIPAASTSTSTPFSAPESPVSPTPGPVKISSIQEKEDSFPSKKDTSITRHSSSPSLLSSLPHIPDKGIVDHTDSDSDSGSNAHSVCAADDDDDSIPDDSHHDNVSIDAAGNPEPDDLDLKLHALRNHSTTTALTTETASTMTASASAAGTAQTPNSHSSSNNSSSINRILRHLQDDPHTVFLGDAGPGDSFGELALLYDAPRAATVTTLTPACILYRVAHQVFRHAVHTLAATSSITFKNEKMQLLKQIDFLQHCSDAVLHAWSKHLTPRPFRMNDVLCQQGQPVECFWILAHGSARVTNIGRPELKEIKKGEEKEKEKGQKKQHTLQQQQEEYSESSSSSSSSNSHLHDSPADSHVMKNNDHHRKQLNEEEDFTSDYSYAESTLIGPGMYIGEFALLPYDSHEDDHNDSATATSSSLSSSSAIQPLHVLTVTALEDGLFWTMDRDTFYRHLMINDKSHDKSTPPHVHLRRHSSFKSNSCSIPSDLIRRCLDRKKLSALPLFQHVDPPTIRSLAKRVETMQSSSSSSSSFRAGESILVQGSTVEAALYLIRSGKVRIVTDQKKVIVLDDVQCFGLNQLKLDFERGYNRLSDPTTLSCPYSVTALTDDTVIGVLTLAACRQCLDTLLLGKKNLPGEILDSLVYRPIPISKFTRHRIVGAGTFGQVWLVSRTCRTTGEARAYALKVQCKYELVRKHQAKAAVREKTVMSKLHSPFLMSLWSTYQDPQFVYLLMSWLPGGELYALIHSRKRDGLKNENEARFYMAGVSEGLSYMHRRGFVYRDVKPENVLINARGYPVLVDFGFAKYIDQDQTYTLCGTPLYLAPEVILNRGHNYAADNWSFAVLVYETLLGYTPFYRSGMSQVLLYKAIIRNKYHLSLRLSPNAAALIQALLVKDPDSRLGSGADGSDAILQTAAFFQQPQSPHHPGGGTTTTSAITTATANNITDGIDLEKLRRQELPAPREPTLKNPLDTHHFEDWSHLEDKTLKQFPTLPAEKAAIFDQF